MDMKGLCQKTLTTVFNFLQKVLWRCAHGSAFLYFIKRKNANLSLHTTHLMCFQFDKKGKWIMPEIMSW